MTAEFIINEQPERGQWGSPPECGATRSRAKGGTINAQPEIPDDSSPFVFCLTCCKSPLRNDTPRRLNTVLALYPSLRSRETDLTLYSGDSRP